MNRVRSVAIVGLTWALVWAGLLLVVGTVIGWIDPDQIDAGEEPRALAPRVALAGFVCGVLFAVVVAIAERSPAPSPQHLVFWGLAVAAALPFVVGLGVQEMIVTAPLGALSALVAARPLSRLAA